MEREEGREKERGRKCRGYEFVVANVVGATEE
jgi:hypothetical protein